MGLSLDEEPYNQNNCDKNRTGDELNTHSLPHFTSLHDLIIKPVCYRSMLRLLQLGELLTESRCRNVALVIYAGKDEGRRK